MISVEPRFECTTGQAWIHSLYRCRYARDELEVPKIIQEALLPVQPSIISFATAESSGHSFAKRWLQMFYSFFERRVEIGKLLIVGLGIHGVTVCVSVD